MIMDQELAISICIMSNGLKVFNSFDLCSKFNYTNFTIDVVAVASDSNLSKLRVENVNKGS